MPNQLIHPRIPADLLERVDEWAASTDRTRNNAIVHLLRRALDAEAADPGTGLPLPAPSRQRPTPKRVVGRKLVTDVDPILKGKP